MADEKLTLMTSQPPPELEQTVLRIHNDVKQLHANMTAAQVRSSNVILEDARDKLSMVLDRGRLER